MQFFSLGILSAGAALILELLTISTLDTRGISDRSSFLFAVLLFPLVEECLKMIFLFVGWKKYTHYLPSVPLKEILSNGFFFGLGFAVPELILLQSSQLLPAESGSIFLFLSLPSIHITNSFILSLASSPRMRSKSASTAILLFLALLLHGTYNFFIFSN